MPVPKRTRGRAFSILQPLAAGLLAAWGGTAAAQLLLPPVPAAAPVEEERRPWYVGAQQTFAYESNVFRSSGDPAVSSVPEESDRLSSTALLAGVDRPFGRQRIRGDAALAINRFDEFDDLDHEAWRVRGRLDWETVGRLSGNLELRSQRELVRHDEIDDLTSIEKHMVRVDDAIFTARLGGVGRLGIEGRVGYQNAAYDSPLPQVESRSHDQTFGSLGVIYRPGGLLTLGAAVRYTKGEYDDLDPVVSPIASNEFDRQDVDLTATWEPTGISRLVARLSATRHEFDEEILTPDFAQQDFSGVTGALQWDWRPTGKLRVITDLLRETGNQVLFEQAVGPGGDPVITGGAQVRTVDRIALRALWAATAKISVEGGLRHQRRDFERAAGDRATGLSLGVNWEPRRSIGLGCAVGHTTRESGDDAREYDLNTASCFARFLLG